MKHHLLIIGEPVGADYVEALARLAGWTVQRQESSDWPSFEIVKHPSFGISTVLRLGDVEVSGGEYTVGDEPEEVELAQDWVAAPPTLDEELDLKAEEGDANEDVLVIARRMQEERDASITIGRSLREANARLAEEMQAKVETVTLEKEGYRKGYDAMALRAEQLDNQYRAEQNTSTYLRDRLALARQKGAHAAEWASIFFWSFVLALGVAAVATGKIRGWWL